MGFILYIGTHKIDKILQWFLWISLILNLWLITFTIILKAQDSFHFHVNYTCIFHFLNNLKIPANRGEQCCISNPKMHYIVEGGTHISKSLVYFTSITSKKGILAINKNSKQFRFSQVNLR